MSPNLQESNGVRTFKDPIVQADIDRALASLPAGHKLAIVAHADLPGVDNGGASLSAVFKLGDSWSVGADVYKAYSGPWGGEAKIVYSPF